MLNYENSEIKDTRKFKNTNSMSFCFNLKIEIFKYRLSDLR